MLWFILFFVLLDLATKYWSVAILQDTNIHIFGDFLSLRLAHNTGVAFSFPIEWILLKGLTVILIGAILFYYYRREKYRGNRTIDIAYALVLGWAISNGIERIFIGKVTDFIAVKYFAIFNFADIFISVGALILFLFYFFHERNSNRDHR